MEKLADVDDRTHRRKLARQAARSVLPNATETMIFVTANARALRHFIELRGCEWAETEIRKVALELLRIMRDEAPNLFSATTRSSAWTTARRSPAPLSRRCNEVRAQILRRCTELARTIRGS